MLFGLLLLEKYGVSAVTNCPLGVVYDIVAVLYKKQGLEQSRLLFLGGDDMQVWNLLSESKESCKDQTIRLQG